MTQEELKDYLKENLELRIIDRSCPYCETDRFLVLELGGEEITRCLIN